MASLLHLLGQSMRPLWLDEAATYWTARHGVWAILQGIGADGTPPLYFLLAKASVRVFGGGELALRLPSIVAALALIPAIYVVTNAVAGMRAALIAAALAAISPLTHYYAVEARNYSLLMLETTGILYAFIRATEEPRRLRWWMTLGCVQAAQLLTHIYGVFLLPIPVLAAFLVGERSSLSRRIVGAAGTVLVAVAVCSPWLHLALVNANSGVSDWIRDFWVSIPPAWAIPQSIEAFGFGGAYPPYLSYMALAPNASRLGLGLTLLLLVFAFIGKGDTGRSKPGHVSMLFLFLGTPLIAAWTWSVLAQPLYLPGRYDTVVLPVFLILLGIGFDRLFRFSRAGVLVAVVVLGYLAVLSWIPALGPTVAPDPVDQAAGLDLGRDARPGDVVVSTSLRGAVTEYYATRAGFVGAFTTFPSETNQHPGWYSAPRLLRDRNRLAEDGRETAARLAAIGQQGHGVWLVASQPNEIDDALWNPLLEQMDFDQTRSHPDVRLFFLKPRVGR